MPKRIFAIGVLLLASCGNRVEPSSAVDVVVPSLVQPAPSSTGAASTEAASTTEIRIKVRAARWFWSFDYGEGLPPASDLVIPVGTTAALELVGADGLSYELVADSLARSFLFPPHQVGRAELRFDHELEAPLRCGACSDTTRPMNPSILRVVSRAEYDAWQHDRDPLLRLPTREAAGKLLFEKSNCSVCHRFDDSPSFGPALARRMGSKMEDAQGNKRVFNDDYVVESILRPAAFIAKGFTNQMPAFTFRDADARAIAAYLRTLR